LRPKRSAVERTETYRRQRLKRSPTGSKSGSPTSQVKRLRKTVRRIAQTIVDAEQINQFPEEIPSLHDHHGRVPTTLYDRQPCSHAPSPSSKDQQNGVPSVGACCPNLPCS
jgi:hypothetical protein